MPPGSLSLFPGELPQPNSSLITKSAPIFFAFAVVNFVGNRRVSIDVADQCSLYAIKLEGADVFEIEIRGATGTLNNSKEIGGSELKS